MGWAACKMEHEKKNLLVAFDEKPLCDLVFNANAKQFAATVKEKYGKYLGDVVEDLSYRMTEDLAKLVLIMQQAKQECGALDHEPRAEHGLASAEQLKNYRDKLAEYAAAASARPAGKKRRVGGSAGAGAGAGEDEGEDEGEGE